MKVKNILLALTLIALFCPAWGWAAGIETERKSLEGIRAVRVVVEKFDSENRKMGLTQEAMKTDVVLQLRKAGIQVVETPGPGLLYINVIAGETDKKDVCYAPTVTFHQPVILARNLWSTFGITWMTGVIGACEKSIVRKSVRDAVVVCIDKFINDYLSANPKK